MLSSLVDVQLMELNEMFGIVFFFFKQKTAYEMCGRDWSSDVCSSDLRDGGRGERDGWREGGMERGTRGRAGGWMEKGTYRVRKEGEKGMDEERNI